MKTKWLIIFTLSLVCHFSYTQNFTNYTENNGLPSNHVYKITQDAHGFIWIATDKGLVRYNGSEFRTFTTQDGLSTSDIWNMFPTPDGRMWYISKSPLIGFIENDSVYNFSTAQGNEIFNPLFAGIIDNKITLSGINKSFILNDQKIWEEKKFKKKGYKHLAYLVNKKWSFFTYKNNSEWILINDKKSFTFPNLIKGKVTKSRGQITDSLLFYTSSDSYHFINLNSLNTHSKSFENEIGFNTVKFPRIHLANDEIQISGSNFIGKINSSYTITDIRYIDKNLNSHFSFLDKENTLWIATFSNGIYKIPEIKQDIIYSFPKCKVGKLRKVNGKIIATVFGKGFYQYNEISKTFNSYLDNDKYLYDALYLPSIGVEYYLTNREIILINKGKKFTFNSQTQIYGTIDNENARSLTYLDGYLYGHYTIGVNKLNPFSVDIVDTYEQAGVNDVITFKNKVIIATNNGMMQIKDDKICPINNTFTKAISGFIQLSEDELLINTDGYGSYITNLTDIHKLSSTAFLNVSDAHKEGNRLWLATNKGVWEYQKKEENYTLVRKMNKKDGLPTDKINSIITVDNRLLVATNLGIANVPLDKKATTGLLDIYINRAAYNDRIINSKACFLYEKNNVLDFNIATINFSDSSEEMEYAYKLIPIQKNWHTTTTRDLNFNDLQPNDYQLLIKSGGTKKTLYFSILPKWYQSLVFKLISFLTLVVSIIFFTRYLSIQSEKKRNKELIQSKQFSELQLKALRSQMNPHFVFNSLTAIQYYINENDFETSDTYLVKFSRLIRDFFNLSKEQTISIEREVELLRNYLELEQLRFKGKLSYEITIDPALNIKKEIPTMLLQPIVENAVNHGIFNKESNGIVEISFYQENVNQLMVIIKDDGVGIDKTIKDEKRFKSTSVLSDRVRFLNNTGLWKIMVERNDAFTDIENKGHIVTFNIKQYESNV